VELTTAGGYPATSYLWQSTSHDEIVANCRGGIVRLSQNVPISVRLTSGQAYSDVRSQTTWSMFDTSFVAVPGSLLYVPYQSVFSLVNQAVSTFCGRPAASRGICLAEGRCLFFFLFFSASTHTFRCLLKTHCSSRPSAAPRLIQVFQIRQLADIVHSNDAFTYLLTYLFSDDHLRRRRYCDHVSLLASSFVRS